MDTLYLNPHRGRRAGEVAFLCKGHPNTRMRTVMPPTTTTIITAEFPKTPKRNQCLKNTSPKEKPITDDLRPTAFSLQGSAYRGPSPSRHAPTLPGHAKFMRSTSQDTPASRAHLQLHRTRQLHAPTLPGHATLMRPPQHGMSISGSRGRGGEVGFRGEGLHSAMSPLPHGC